MDCKIELSGEGEPIDAYERTVGTTATEESCHECKRPIAVGAEAEIVTGEFEGEPIRWVTCLDCMHIAEGLSKDRIHGTLWSDLEECDAFEGFNTGCLTKIPTASARAYVFERWRKWRELA